jgi:hypothetical protein
MYLFQQKKYYNIYNRTNSEKNMELFVTNYLKEQIYVHPIYTYYIVVFSLYLFFHVKAITSTHDDNINTLYQLTP